MTESNPSNAPYEFKLAPMQERIFLTILQAPAGEIATKRMIYEAMRTDIEGNSINIGNSLSVHICHIRKKLKPHGIDISVAWGRGYFINKESRDKIKAIIETAA